MKIRVLFGAAALALAAATVTTMPTLPASAATASAHAVQSRPGHVGSRDDAKAKRRHALQAKRHHAVKVKRTDPAKLAPLALAGTSDAGVSSTPLSTWQTNNTVWALAYSGGVVYAGGQFTSVRPPGDPLGTGEVPRTFLAAFNSSTGALVTSFDPTITGGSAAEVTALAVSGNTLYVGGNFNHVNGVYRDNLAAFNLTTGALLSWAPTAFGTVLSIAPSPDGSEIYLGGDFNELDGVARTYAGAVSGSGTGTLDAWDPVLNDSVTSVAVAPDDSRVVVGGYFTEFNGVTQNAIGSTYPTTGASDPNFTATIVPNYAGCSSSVKDVIIAAAGTSSPSGIAYVAAEGTGGGCFDGDFAFNVATGSLIWQNDCLGATQALVVINNWLFKGSHAHDCAYAPGGFPQVNNGSGGWVSHHLLDQSLTDGSLGHFTPDTSSPNNGLGPRVLATDGKQLFLGGDFTLINGGGQQGFAIFPSAVDPQSPTRPSVAPTVTSTSSGVDTVSFPAVSSRDVGTLSYAIYRDSGTKPIATLSATSWPWALPVLHYQDTGLVPGSSHTYTYTASDGPHTTAKSPASASVTVASTSPTLTYEQAALADNPSFFWPLNETSGSTAHDASPHGFNGSYESGTTQGVPGPIAGQKATAFDGSSGNVVSASQVTNPQDYSIELWFKTTTNTGGKLVGFGDAQTGSSGSYDRHVYMMNDGQIVYGVWTGQTETIETPDVYNDGQWHYLAATLDPTHGMSLYIDGHLVGTNATTSAQAYNGYWRVGGDNLGGWNLDPWGSNSQGTTEPNSYYFQGSIADVAVYPTALSAAQVLTHYAAALQQGA
jgi:hypothetical protein